jgi:hypothetical protein
MLKYKFVYLNLQLSSRKQSKVFKKTCLLENMDINIELNQIGLQRVMNFHDNVGDFFFMLFQLY